MTIKTDSIVDGRKIHLGRVKNYKASTLAAKTASKQQDLYNLNVFSNQGMNLNKHGLN